MHHDKNQQCEFHFGFPANSSLLRSLGMYGRAGVWLGQRCAIDLSLIMAAMNASARHFEEHKFNYLRKL